VRITEVELENYRQYRGCVKVELLYDEERNINVIQGVNGSGKTNFLNAINWCLYDEEESIEKYSDRTQPIINDAEFDNLSVGESLVVKVAIKMVDKNDRLYVFERSMKVRKDQNRDPQYYDFNFNVFVQVGRDMELIGEPDFLLNRILPKAIKNFFIFDGEKLDDFFKIENSSKIRDAIYDVSQLTLLDSGIVHLDQTLSYMRSKIKGQTPKIDELKEKIKEIEKGLTSYQTIINEKQQELEEVKKQLREISNKLMSSNIELIKELEKKRDDLNKRIADLETKIEENQNLAIKNIINMGPKILSLEAINYTLNEIKEKTQMGEIPPKIKDTFIDELLERKICICGRDISEGEPRKNVENLKNEMALSVISSELIDLKYSLNSFMKEIKEFTNLQNNYRKNVITMEEERDQYRREIRNLEAMLQNVGTSDIDINNLIIIRNQLEKKKSQLQEEILLKSYKSEEAKKLLEKYRRELTYELKKYEQYKNILKQLEMGEDAYDLLVNVRQNLINDIRNTIQEKTKEYFLKLIWKKDTYEKVMIDDSYNISVINKMGSECLGTLAAGERQVLALSFLAALREVSGFDAPVIIDTPLGRISKEPRENIAELLPSFLKGTQVTMLMTDEEYTDAVRSKLSRNVITEYELRYIEADSRTEVVKFGQS